LKEHLIEKKSSEVSEKKTFGRKMMDCMKNKHEVGRKNGKNSK
jgi:hypothetical protein